MAVVLKKGVYIVAGKRTPFGKLVGSLRDVLPEDLFATAAKGAFKACGVAPEMVDTVNIGQEILIGSANVALAGGMENLSSIQFVLRNIRYGTDLGTRYIMEDQLNTSNYDTYCGLWLLQTADVLAKKYGISRSECDEYALESQRRWAIADEGGIFDAELTPVSIKIKHKDAVFMKDEHPRPNVTLQQLNKLPNMYKDGVVTSGHLCGVCDGAAAVILCNDEVLNKQNVKPLSRIVGWSWVGVDPAVMALGPIPAVQSLLSNAKLTIEDVDIFEIHETYAPQVLTCCKELGVDRSKVNLNGGAIPIGHPSGASGSRLVSHLSHELRRKGLKLGIATACIGGGQGIALLIESVN